MDKWLLMISFAVLGVVSALLIVRTREEEVGPSTWIRMNQVGFLPSAQKTAYVLEGGEKPFRIVRSEDGEIAFGGTLTPLPAPDPCSGDVLSVADFTPLTTPGTYRLEIEELGRSGSFEVGSGVYRGLYRDSLRALTFQRCGTAVEVGRFGHAACHRDPSRTWGVVGRLVSLPGGWHDAGNYDRYLPTATVTAWTLLRLLEAGPAIARADDLGIPESGNGLPDLLDEVRFELAWMLGMQREDGAVHHKQAKAVWTPVLPPEQDRERRFLYPVSSTATAGFAAVMARGSVAFREVDPELSSRLREASERAWLHLGRNPGIFPAGGFRNPEGVEIQGGEYPDANDRDERLWAAAELYRATGGAAYRRAIEETWRQMGKPIDYPITWSRTKTCAFLTLLGSDLAELGSQTVLSLVGYCEQMLRQLRCSGYPVSLSRGEFSWGSNALVLNVALLFLEAHRLMDLPQYRGVALEHLDYILGANATGHAFVTGFGWRSPLHPHHQPSETDDHEAPVPGFLVGGPNSHQFPRHPEAPARCYEDSFDNYFVNEVAINWNAPLVYVTAHFAGGPEE